MNGKNWSWNRQITSNIFLVVCFYFYFVQRVMRVVWCGECKIFDGWVHVKCKEEKNKLSEAKTINKNRKYVFVLNENKSSSWWCFYSQLLLFLILFVIPTCGFFFFAFLFNFWLLFLFFRLQSLDFGLFLFLLFCSVLLPFLRLLLLLLQQLKVLFFISIQYNNWEKILIPFKI